jgi:multidrug transporter EmrE-like cation transporter
MSHIEYTNFLFAQYMSLLRVGVLAVLEVFGDFMLKDYATTGAVSKLGLGVLGYVGVIMALVWSFHTGNVLLVNGMWDGMSAIIESVAAYLILGDRLSNPYQYAGLAMTVIGVFFLKYEPKSF